MKRIFVLAVLVTVLLYCNQANAKILAGNRSPLEDRTMRLVVRPLFAVMVLSMSFATSPAWGILCTPGNGAAGGSCSPPAGMTTMCSSAYPGCNTVITGTVPAGTPACSTVLQSYPKWCTQGTVAPPTPPTTTTATNSTCTGAYGGLNQFCCGGTNGAKNYCKSPYVCGQGNICKAAVGF